MKTKALLSLFILLGIGNVISAQQEVIPLWPGIAPGSETWTQKEVQYLNEQGQQMVRNVVTPTLTVYKPDPAKSNGTAMIVAPGGGFLFLSWQTEGTEVAEWLTSKGVTAFLLKYRLTNSGSTREEFQKAMMTLFSSISAASKPENAPPLFILVAGDDPLSVSGSIQMYSSWKAAGKDAELHMYSIGGHGFGMQKKGLPVDSWIERLWDWMKYL